MEKIIYNKISNNDYENFLKFVTPLIDGVKSRNSLAQLSNDEIDDAATDAIVICLNRHGYVRNGKMLKFFERVFLNTLTKVKRQYILKKNDVFRSQSLFGKDKNGETTPLDLESNDHERIVNDMHRKDILKKFKQLKKKHNNKNYSLTYKVVKIILDPPKCFINYWFKLVYNATIHGRCSRQIGDSRCGKEFIFRFKDHIPFEEMTHPHPPAMCCDECNADIKWKKYKSATPSISLIKKYLKIHDQKWRVITTIISDTLNRMD